ncbi:MAG TPA: sigma-70 family RNA polymerase sigma factor [Chitinophagaceae bacterium]|nr:sigma-70 family RNA polymerase sigma factor [Chitinophagaceae bacterium]
MAAFSHAVSDDSIVRNLKESAVEKRRAEEVLFSRYMYLINEGIHKYSLTEEESFNAYSDSILQTIYNVTNDNFENRSSLKTYLYRIFSNKCVDLIRKKTTNKSSVHQTAPVSDMLSVISDPAKTIIQQLVEKADYEKLKSCLAKIGETCRQLLTMFSEGYPDKHIAVIMEYKSADVVKVSRLRCLDKLRQLYV